MIIPGLPSAGREIGETFPTNPSVCCVGKLGAQRRCWPNSLGKEPAGVRDPEHSFLISLECFHWTRSSPFSDGPPVGKEGGEGTDKAGTANT